MVIFVYGITKDGKDIHLDAGGDMTRGTEIEKRLMGCVDTAVRAAIIEVIRHVEGNRLIEKKMIESLAEEAVRKFIEENGLE